MSTPAPSIFRFHDYRSYLQGWYQWKKDSQPGWSYGRWARQLGLKSAAGIHMVVSGTRTPGPRLIEAMARQLDLSKAESEYLADLVRLQRNSTRRDTFLSSLLLEKLSARSSRSRHRMVEPLQFAAIAKWHYYMLRELVRLPSFREDPAWIAERIEPWMKLTDAEIKSALRIMLKLGLLARTDDGRLVATTEHVETHSDLVDEGLKRFHEETLDHARAALRRVPPAEREISGATFPIAPASLPQAKELIRKFHNDFCDLVESAEGEAIYHLEVALFPLWRNR